jgi:hypothetical protein
MKTKTITTVTTDNSNPNAPVTTTIAKTVSFDETNTNLLNVHFFIEGGVPKVIIGFIDSNGITLHQSVHPVSDFTTITAQQKSTLQTIVRAMVVESLTLDGFA